MRHIGSEVGYCEEDEEEVALPGGVSTGLAGCFASFAGLSGSPGILGRYKGPRCPQAASSSGTATLNAMMRDIEWSVTTGK